MKIKVIQKAVVNKPPTWSCPYLIDEGYGGGPSEKQIKDSIASQKKTS